MNFALSLLFVFVVMLGLGGWLPSRHPGVRFAFGAAAIPFTMHIGAVTFDLPLSWLGWALVVMALAGFARQWWRTAPAFQPGSDRLSHLLHPVHVLPFLIIAIGLGHGDVGYVPYGQDEFTSWLYWPRQEYLADRIWRADMWWNITGYVQGWPLSIVFAQTPWSEFAGIRAIAVATLWHVALIAAAYDVVKEALRRTLVSERTSILVAWAFVLLLLTAEAAWTLVPQLVQVEVPQVYFLAATFVLAISAAEADHRESLVRALVCGLCVAAAYTIKIANVAAIPGLLAIAAAWTWRQSDWRTRLLGLAAFFGPFLVAALVWGLFTPFAATQTCFTQLGATTGSRVAELLSPAGRATAVNMLQASLSYIAAFKLPVTLVAASGLVAGLRRHAAIVIGVLAFTAVYVVALLPIYAFCLTSTTPVFDSLQRYLLVPLRTIHVTGMVLLALAAVDICRRSADRWPGLRRSLPAAASLVGAVLLSLQAVAVHRAVGNVSTRYRENPEPVATIIRLDREASALRTLVRQHFDNAPSVAIVAQGTVGFELSIAQYLALGTTRSDRLAAYTMYWGYNWSPVSSDRHTTARTATELAEDLRRLDIIWPFLLDDWTRSVLEAIRSDAGCQAELASTFLLRVGNRTFDCFEKGAFSVERRNGSFE